MSSLLILPNELLLQIAHFLASEPEDASSFDFHSTLALLKTCRQLASLLTPLLYKACLADQGSRALEWAATSDSLTVARLLIETYGVDVNIHTDAIRLTTPLHHAAMGGNVEMTRYLLEQGADANASTAVYPSREVFRNRRASELGGWDKDWAHFWFAARPVHCAVNSGSVELLQLLRERNADTACTVFGNFTVYSAYNKEYSLVDIAAARGHVAVFKDLTEEDGVLRQGLDFNIPTMDAERTPLMYAVEGLFTSSCLESEGRTKIVQTILAAGPVDIFYVPYDAKLMYTVLEYAAYKGTLEMLQMMVIKFGFIQNPQEDCWYDWQNDGSITTERKQQLQSLLNSALQMVFAHSGAAFFEDSLIRRVDILLRCGAAAVEPLPDHSLVVCNMIKNYKRISCIAPSSAMKVLMNRGGDIKPNSSNSSAPGETELWILAVAAWGELELLEKTIKPESNQAREFIEMTKGVVRKMEKIARESESLMHEKPNLGTCRIRYSERFQRLLDELVAEIKLDREAALRPLSIIPQQ